MNVFHYPCIPTEVNPYNHLLISALNDQGYNAYACYSIAYLYRQLLSRKVLAVHFHWLDRAGGHMNLVPSKFIWQFAILSLIITCRLAGIRTIWTIHNLHTHNSTEFGVFFYRLISILIDVIITHSPASIPIISATYQVRQDKVKFIPHGNYPQAFASRNFPTAQPPSSGRLRFLYFGNISPYKGLDILASALQEISDKLGDLYPDITILGTLNTSKYPLLTTQLHECKNLTLVSGFVDDSILAKYLEEADIVVLPFRYTFTSGSLIYALSAGKPVLIPDLETIRYYLSPNFSFTFIPKSINSLTSVLLNICTTHSRSSLLPMGDAARTFAETLSWTSIARKTAFYYSTY
jgi:beta-1,4-mannosyltransferase